VLAVVLVVLVVMSGYNSVKSGQFATFPVYAFTAIEWNGHPVRWLDRVLVRTSDL